MRNPVSIGPVSPLLAPSKISVIIPTYNRAPFISRTIRSALEQSRPSYEIIVIDDGSTDGTREELQPFVDRGEIRCLFLKNGGVAVARNAGIRAAAGDYLAFLDDDDLWLPGHLEQLASALARHPGVQMAFSGFRFFASGERSDSDVQNAAFRRSVPRMLERGFVRTSEHIWLSKDSFLTALFELGFTFRIQGAMVSRKLVLDRDLRFDEGMPVTQDGQFVLETALHTPALFVPSVGVEVRRHGENFQDRRYHDKMVKNYQRAIERSEEFFKNKLNRRERRALEESIQGLQGKIILMRTQDLPYAACVKEGLLLIRKSPSSGSLRSLVKMLLGRRLLTLLQTFLSGNEDGSEGRAGDGNPRPTTVAAAYVPLLAESSADCSPSAQG